MAYYADKLTISELKPKFFYIQAGAIRKEMGYVYSGLLRAFYVDGSGKEITVNLAMEGNYATHYTTFGTDKPSKSIITANIEVFLNHCLRFYDRQFVTRENINRDVLSRFEQLLNGYFESDKEAVSQSN